MKLNITFIALIILVAGCDVSTDRVPQNFIAQEQEKTENELINGATGDGMFVTETPVTAIDCSALSEDSRICSFDCNQDSLVDCLDWACSATSLIKSELSEILSEQGILCTPEETGREIPPLHLDPVENKDINSTSKLFN